MEQQKYIKQEVRGGMKDLLKIFLGLALICAAGFGIWKMVTKKNIKTQDDLKKEYGFTCKNILRIANAVDQSLNELGTVPRVSSINSLVRYVERFEKIFSVKDFWGNELLYQYIDESHYAIASPGSDGFFNGFDQEEGKYAEYNGEDVILETGVWKLAPKEAEY